MCDTDTITAMVAECHENYKETLANRSIEYKFNQKKLEILDKLSFENIKEIMIKNSKEGRSNVDIELYREFFDYCYLDKLGNGWAKHSILNYDGESLLDFAQHHIINMFKEQENMGVIKLKFVRQHHSKSNDANASAYGMTDSHTFITCNIDWSWKLNESI